MTVVSNTSPILNLACIGELRLLEALYGRVLIPPQVRSEIERLKETEPRFRDVSLPSFVQVVEEINRVRIEALTLDLDPGEAAAISLALDLRSELILLDERRGRATARRLGLSPFGLLGVLIEARQKGVLPALKPALAKLEVDAGFWLSDELKRQALVAVDERP